MWEKASAEIAKEGEEVKLGCMQNLLGIFFSIGNNKDMFSLISGHLITTFIYN